jgi:hypothetical protein
MQALTILACILQKALILVLQANVNATQAIPGALLPERIARWMDFFLVAVTLIMVPVIPVVKGEPLYLDHTLALQARIIKAAQIQAKLG